MNHAWNSPPAPHGASPAPTCPSPMGSPAPPAPNRWPAWRIVDLVVTIALFAVYAFGVVALLYISLFWAMATDSCGSTGCDYGKLQNAYFLSDICGVLVYVVSLVVAIVLLVLRRPAFWLPILGAVIQAALFAAALGQLAGVSPN
ncbi:DUF6264 family protein [Tsukamurella pulmonis]|uniref:DUF6264 family protein n=1 Tax=Tsukamurella pulmonis TaxID=47312 RepID=UPI001EE07095|nr:DUF6264 family protein [Tsukamurella pulmonis]